MQSITGAATWTATYFFRLTSLGKKGSKLGLILLYAMLMVNKASAQLSSDTLDMAKKFKSDGKLNKAAALLKIYHSAHPTDLNSTWVYAQTEYWLQNFKEAKNLYKQAVTAHPTNYYLQLDYANFLISIGEPKKAKPVLASYHAFDSTSTGFKAAIASMFWMDKHRKVNERLYNTYKPASADTLNKVKQLKGKGKYRDSYKLLKLYYKSHDADFNTTWLFAQVSYLSKHLKRSKQLYKKAALAQTSNYYLKLDYANTLVNLADYNKALPLLNDYKNYDPTNIKAELGLAKVYLAQGNFELVEKNIRLILAQEPGNADALVLLDQLHLAKASSLKIKGAYTIDSQPLQTITPAAEVDVYLHPEATLKLNLQTPLFIRSGLLQNAQWLQLGDVSSFRKSGFQLAFDAGGVKQPYGNKISWTANLELKKTFFKHLVLQAQAERKPYYYTISSLDTVIMVTRASAYAEWNDQNSFNGHIGFEYNGFVNKNYVIGGGGWIFSPPLKVSVLEFRIGYAYSYSTAKQNKFVPEKTLAEILNPYDASAPITGIYSPYFTPDNISSHAALASIIAHPTKNFDIGFNANVGFYATASTPYFYLDTNQTGATVIAKNYATEKFYPMEFSAYVLLRITKKISLKADYAYRKTYFYTSNSAGVGLKINFWNDKKGQ